eukprot:TRINITY_DN5283_c0_g1_i2.p1 TRINITY_DN5283_c0_g1~~TRINITY_DN5283_c0_g1_i2.p1  ORF type:complete len:2305 (-),score=689.54 TRINITY_DN5283_c0_g1_i2:325-7239(-)
MFGKLMSNKGRRSGGSGSMEEAEADPERGSQEGMFQKLKGKNASHRSQEEEPQESSSGPSRPAGAFQKLTKKKGSQGSDGGGSARVSLEEEVLEPLEMEDNFDVNVPAVAGIDASQAKELLAEETRRTSMEEEVLQPEETGEGGEEGESKEKVISSGDDILTTQLGELALDPAVAVALRWSFTRLIETTGSKMALASAIYNAVYDGAPTLQPMFVTSRVVQAGRLLAGLEKMIELLERPRELKTRVEMFGFGHFNLEITATKAAVFRDAVLDFLDVELNQELNSNILHGWRAILNYGCGAIIYIKNRYAQNMEILGKSWQQVQLVEATGTAENNEQTSGVQKKQGDVTGSGNAADGDEKKKDKGKGGQDSNMGQAIPTTFVDMFKLSSAMMGFSDVPWMNEVLNCFETMVMNAANSPRLRQEAEVLVLRITKVHEDHRTIKLGEFKNCMLAGLRSLLSKTWDTAQELAWQWMWEQVEKILQELLGKPVRWEREVETFLASLDENQRYQLRKTIFSRFFVAAPAGQDLFKQSDTRLHFIADRMLESTVSIYKDPWAMITELSALGLRHVGYGVPPDLFAPFVSQAVEVYADFAADETVTEGFRWSLGLVSSMLVRTIHEGTSIVMQAIIMNSAKQLRAAVRLAPRGDRATWVLRLQVGTQSISPLIWAIDSGALDVARAVLEDLLTIRADREKYYFGVTPLFERHPDIVVKLIKDAPMLLPGMLNGMVWRSRTAKEGLRRVNYYVEHLVRDNEGMFAPTLGWLVEARDPKIIAHPVIVLVSDTVWNGLVKRQFSLSKIWFVFSLFVFVMAQAVLPRMDNRDDEIIRVFILLGRIINYVLTMGRLIITHVGASTTAFKTGETYKVKVGRFNIPVCPHYVAEGYQLGSFLLMIMLTLLCAHEPMFLCLDFKDIQLPPLRCVDQTEYIFRYSIFSMLAMILHWTLVVDLAVFNTALSAFCLVVNQVLSEIGRFVIAFIFLLLTFATAVSVLQHSYIEMMDTGAAVVCLFAITLQIYEDDYRDMLDDPALLVAVFLFVLFSAILLLNLLVAQLGCSYEYIYQDSVGYARLRRAQVICETIEVCPVKKWNRFLTDLGLHLPIEFNEGDVGLSGGMQILEEGSLHPVTVDTITRYGGSCAPELPWPEDDSAQLDGDDDRFDRMEEAIQKTLKKLAGEKNGSGSGSQDEVDIPGSKDSGYFGSTTDEFEDAEIERKKEAMDATIRRQRQSSVNSLDGHEMSMVMQAAAAAAEAENDEENGDSVNTDVFEELVLNTQTAKEITAAWMAFVNSTGSRDKAGEALYTTLADGAPMLSSMFTNQPAIQAMKLVSGFNTLIMDIENPAQLKANVETLGFGHMAFQVDTNDVECVRDAILDLFFLELGDKFSRPARLGWRRLLNYVGGAIIYVKHHYAERLRLLSESWMLCNGDEKEKEAAEDAAEEGMEENEKNTGAEEQKSKKQDSNVGLQNIPTTFKEMFTFNAAVMGMADGTSWMEEVLEQFDGIVGNVSDSNRLVQECDLLCMRISKKIEREQRSLKAVSLGEFKSCMLAALRSLLPKIWSTAHEVAWAWLWESVERLLEKSLYKPLKYEAALGELLESIDEETGFQIRKDFYTKFFEYAPTGQEFFKQSDTRLHFISETVIKSTLKLYLDPWNMADELSAIGLRHVGFNIPTDLFPPFVQALMAIFGTVSDDQNKIDAFHWSLSVTSSMLVRTIKEGSTIVMKAINANSVKALQKAMACAPRRERARWCLIIQVGTQNISPLSWAIESGSFESARAIIDDLLTIRADRERYYYGTEELFGRHPDIIHRVVQDAIVLLPPLLDGLLWRSRNTSHGMRRVNYYVKHIVQDAEGQFSGTLDWIASAKDPKIISHMVVVLVSDTLWSGIVSKQFIYSKVWFLLGLCVFMLSQAILPKMDIDDKSHARIMVLLCRVNLNLFTTTRLWVQHTRAWLRAYRTGQTVSLFGFRFLKVPSYLFGWFDGSSFTLFVLLCLMIVHEPMLWCIGDSRWPTEECPNAVDVRGRYAVFVFGAIAIHWGLCVDFAVFNTGLSAFVLVVAQVMTEIVRFIIALVFLLLMFGSAISVLEHSYGDMHNISETALCLLAITLKIFEQDYRNLRSDPALLCVVFTFVTATSILLLNLLTAQLNCSYEYIYQASVGFARLNRAEVIVETLKTCPDAKWKKFLKTLRFDERLEFNEGDVGLAGGLQVQEPAYLNPVTADRILRFGGSCSPDMPWPEEQKTAEEGDEEKLAKLEEFITNSMKKLLKGEAARSKKKMSLNVKGSFGSAMGSGFGSCMEDDAYDNANEFEEESDEMM